MDFTKYKVLCLFVLLQTYNLDGDTHLIAKLSDFGRCTNFELHKLLEMEGKMQGPWKWMEQKNSDTWCYGGGTTINEVMSSEEELFLALELSQGQLFLHSDTDTMIIERPFWEWSCFMII